MDPKPLMKAFIEKLCPLNRSICSPGLDEALEIIKRDFIPELQIEAYPTGSDAWTWQLPRKWDLKEGRILHQGKELISTEQEPLCVWSGSLPVDGEVSGEELLRHCYSESKRPDLLCWYFRYYGKLDWGFNLPHTLVQTIQPDRKYEVRIDARYYDDTFRVGTAFIPGARKETILITSDICHPYQCNDSLSGAAANLILYRHLKGRANQYSYRFNFVPETIGTVAYLSRHEDEIPKIVYHLYSEFLGSTGKLRFQHSLRGDSALEKIVRDLSGEAFDFFPFRVKSIMNDELVTSMPNLHIPSVAINRGMYPEYHSHHDTPERLDFDLVLEATGIMREWIERLDATPGIGHDAERGSLPLSEACADRTYPAGDFVPKPLFTGPVFLSRYDLWVDWRTQPRLNAALDLVMACLDGINSAAEIAWQTGLPFDDVVGLLERFEEKGLISKMEKLHELEKS